MASEQEIRTVLSPLLSREEPLIWITANSYVRLQGGRTAKDRHERQFILELNREILINTTCTTTHHYISIHASTLEESIICLDYLVGLKDTHFQQMLLTYKGDDDTRLCPLGADILEKLLQNSARRIICFDSMIFTPEHCRTFASSGTKTNIRFYFCQFQDGGAAFVEASATRQDKTSGPAKLRFVRRNPFNDRNLALFLSQHKLEKLYLDELDLNSEVGCRAVATAEVQCLKLKDCDLEDGAAALVESVSQGLGPKGFFFRGNPFDSSERLVTFMNALRGNTYLERLDLCWIHDRQITQALAAALHENKGLVHLAFHVCEMDDWNELLESASMHPSLRSLDLTLRDSLNIYPKKRRELTKTVADMLSVNDRVEVMSFPKNMLDKKDWDAYVSPRLECNVYCKRFPSILKIEEASTRAAVLARALAKFSSKPHLVWMLLSQNHDIISSYLDSANDLNSIPSRKRSRSPSSEGMSAH
jgi:hypothetical protein